MVGHLMGVLASILSAVKEQLYRLAIKSATRRLSELNSLEAL